MRKADGFEHGVEGTGLANTYDNAAEVDILRGYAACCGEELRASLQAMITKRRQHQIDRLEQKQEDPSGSMVAASAATQRETSNSSDAPESRHQPRNNDSESSQDENKFIAGLSALITQKLGGLKAMEWKRQGDATTGDGKDTQKANTRHQKRKRKQQREREKRAASADV
jgi:hypothetical protein